MSKVPIENDFHQLRVTILSGTVYFVQKILLYSAISQNPLIGLYTLKNSYYTLFVSQNTVF